MLNPRAKIFKPELNPCANNFVPKMQAMSGSSATLKPYAKQFNTNPGAKTLKPELNPSAYNFVPIVQKMPVLN